MNKKRECFAMLAMTKKSFAFTLAEVLIVLAVLGVIAAMTIPSLIQDAQEKALVTALQKSYSTFSQAVDMAIAENGPISGWDLGSSNVYNILKPHLKMEYCKLKTGCFANHYKALFNENFAYQPKDWGWSFQEVLTSGVAFLISGRGTYVDIFIDVNGNAGPNRAGVDYFLFKIKPEEGLIPDGNGCVYNNPGTTNGWGCTYWVIKHGNMDYLRKDGKYTKY